MYGCDVHNNYDTTNTSYTTFYISLCPLSACPFPQTPNAPFISFPEVIWLYAGSRVLHALSPIILIYRSYGNCVRHVSLEINRGFARTAIRELTPKRVLVDEQQ